MGVVSSKHTLFGQNRSHVFSTTLQLDISPVVGLRKYLKGHVAEGLRYKGVGTCVAFFATRPRSSTSIMPLSKGVGFFLAVE